MTPVVTIIGNIVTDMKPTISVLGVVMDRDGAIVKVGSLSNAVLDKLFVGEKLKITFAEGVYYSKIVAINKSDLSFTVDLTDKGFAAAPTAISVVLNYHYGHLQEIRNTFVQWTTKASVKREQFPAIVLVQDFAEDVDPKELTREATLKLFILTDTQQHYVASERYTYSFVPILYPLEELFFRMLERSNEVSNYEATYTRFDRLKWGTLKADEGTATNIFNDFIDAIEIENLKLKIINTC